MCMFGKQKTQIERVDPLGKTQGSSETNVCAPGGKVCSPRQSYRLSAPFGSAAAAQSVDSQR